MPVIGLGGWEAPASLDDETKFLSRMHTAYAKMVKELGEDWEDSIAEGDEFIIGMYNAFLGKLAKLNTFKSNSYKYKKLIDTTGVELANLRTLLKTQETALEFKNARLTAKEIEVLEKKIDKYEDHVYRYGRKAKEIYMGETNPMLTNIGELVY